MIRRRERWSYAAGDIGFNFVWQSIELYLLFFYIRRLGLSPATASTIYFVGVVIDWIADPVVGAVADRLAGRVPLRAWVAVGGPLSVGFLILAFAPPPLPRAFLPAETLAVFVLMRLCYSLGNVPYAALTTRISPEPVDHLALTGTRMAGAALGATIAAAIYLVLEHGSGPDSDFRLGAIILAGLALPAFLLTATGVRERVRPTNDPDEARTSLLRGLGALAALVTRAAELRRLLAIILIGGLAVTVVNKSLLFLFEEQGATRLGFYIALVPGLSLLLTAPLWTGLAARIGRVRALILAAGLKATAMLLALLASGLIAVAILITVSIIAGAGLSIMFWSLVPAAVAECERRAHGAGYAGRIYALSNMARKLAQAIAPAVIALALVNPHLSMIWLVAGCTVLAFAVAVLLYGREARLPSAAPAAS